MKNFYAFSVNLPKSLVKGFIMLLSFILLLDNISEGQTPNGFLDFGNPTNGINATTANTGFGGVRIGANGTITLQNPGQTIGTLGELKATAPTTASINSVGITSAEFGTAAQTFTVSFEMHLSGGASGTWYFFAGNGTTFAAAQSNSFSGAQTFTGIQWSFGSSNTITTNNRAAGAWTAVSGTPFAQNVSYYVTIIGNNTASTVNYGVASAYSVAANTYDLWVNGVLVGNDLAKAQLAATTAINAFRFYGENSTGNVAAIALDNIRWYNTCVLPPTHLTLVGVPSTGTVSTNLTSYTSEAHSGSTTGPIANSFTGAITVDKVSGPGNISGTLAPNAVAGIATYANTQFDAPGTYTINATAASPIVPTATSGNIVISGGSSPSLAISGSGTDHGSTCPGTPASTITYTITNNGSVSATGVTVVSDNAQFVVSNISGTTAAASGGTITFDVTFTPTGAGAQSATVTVASTTSGSNSPTLALTGTGTATVTPAVTSAAATLVDAKSATLNGNVTAVGTCPPAVEKGFVYSLTSDNNTPANGGSGVTKTVVAGIATGTFNLALSGLLSSSNYSFRAYVREGANYYYGAVLNFTTSPALVISGTLAHGTVCPNVAASAITYTITNNGASTVSGISIGSSDGQFVASAPSSASIVSGGTATYTITFTPASAGAKSSLITVSSTTPGIVSATNTVTGTGTTPVTPSVTTNAASALVNTTATLNGTVNALGVCPSTTQKGFVWSATATNNDPLNAGIGVTTVPVAGLATGTYNNGLAGLTANTNYSYKAYLFDGTTYTYGAVQTFTTLAAADHLTFVGVPATGNVGVNLTSFTVEARRPDNSVDATYTGNVTITKVTGSGVISGTLTVAAVAGVATFGTIQFDAADTYTINAASGSLTDITSGNITISLAPVVIYLHNFNDVAASTSSPYTTNPTATTGTPTGVFATGLSASSWASSTGAFTNFGGQSGTSLTIQPANGSTSTMTLTFSVASGSQCSITSFDFWRQRTANGPATITSIVINGITVATNLTVPTSGAALGSTAVSNAVSNLTGTVTIVLNLSATGAATQNLRLDNFTLYGNITATCAAPTSQASNITTANITSTGLDAGFTRGTDNGTILVLRPTAQAASLPINGTDYTTANVDWTLAQQININNRVMSRSLAAASSVVPVTGIVNLTPETQYTLTAYEKSVTNCYNTTAPASLSFYTLSTAPGAHPLNFTASPVGSTQIDLAFTAASSITNADGYIILRRADGVPPTATGITNGVASGSWTLPAGTVVVTNISSTSQTTYSNLGLTSGTNYCYLIIPYNWNAVNPETYNYYVSPTLKTACATPTAPAPEINVVQGATNYATASTYNFGNAVVGTNNDIIFTIQNLGDADLTFGTPVVSGAGFSLQSAPVSPVSGPSGTSPFTIRFTPSANGPFSGSVTISNNDSDEGTYVINFTGTGVTPAVAINSINDVAAGSINVGSSGNLLYHFSTAVTTANVTLNSVTLPITLTSAADFQTNGFKLLFNTTNTLAGATTLSSVNPTGATLVFGSLTQSIASGVTGYFFVTADVSPSATTGNVITANALPSANVVFSTTVTKSGTTSDAGTQTIIALPYQAFDDFTRSGGDNLTVGIPSSGGVVPWTEIEASGSTNGPARIFSGQLMLVNTNSSGAAIGNGFVSTTFDMSSKYATNFSTSGGPLNWLFNFRSSRPSPSGFGTGNTYAMAFVVGCTESDVTSATATGYAVVLGNSSSPDPVKLVRFVNGINGTLSDICVSTVVSETNYYSVKVIYNPCNQQWSLQVRDDGSSAFADPLTNTATAVTATDATYTSSDLKYLLCHFKYGASAGENCRFDNIYIPTNVASLSTYVWNGTTTDYQLATNWTPNRNCPKVTDILQFGVAGVNTNITNIPNQTIGQLLITGNKNYSFKPVTASSNTLSIGGGTGTDFQIDNGSTLNLDVATTSTSEAMTVSLLTGTTGTIAGNLVFINSVNNVGRAHRLLVADAGGVNVAFGGLVKALNLTGNPFGSAPTPTDVVVFNAGGVYEFHDGANPFALTQPASKVTFQTGSTYRHKNASTDPSLMGRTYGNFEFDVTSGTVDFDFGSTGNICNIDTLKVMTGTFLFTCSGGTPQPANLNINGNLIVSNGATLDYSPTTAGAASILAFTGSTAAQHITVNTGGTFTLGRYSTLKLNSNYATAPQLTVDNDIRINGILDITKGTLALNPGNITIASTSDYTASVSAIPTGGAISYGAGRFVVERYIATNTHSRAWQFLSTPTTSNQTINAAWQEGYGGSGSAGINGFGTLINGGTAMNGFDGPTGVNIKSYIPSTDQWTTTLTPNSTSSALVNNPNGWMIFVRGDRNNNQANSSFGNATVLRTRGQLYAPGNAPGIATTEVGKYHSIGNPYASSIDLRTLDTTNITDDIYIWDPTLGAGIFGFGRYRTLAKVGTHYEVTPVGGAYPTAIVNEIQSGQAFFVKAQPGKTGTVAFKEDNKVASYKVVTRGGGVTDDVDVELLRVNLSTKNEAGNLEVLDGAMTIFGNFSRELDWKDAAKFINTGENVGFRVKTLLASVERRPTPVAGDTLYLELSNSKQVSYRWTVTTQFMDKQGRSGWLYDRFLKNNTPINLNGETVLDFTVTADPLSAAADRFKIVFDKVAAPTPVKFISITATRNTDRSINVKWKVENETNITGYTIERSADGRTFTGILNTASVNQASYGKDDLSPLAQDNFYRIKASGLGGEITYSDIVKVAPLPAKAYISVYPNPVEGKTAQLIFANQPAGLYHVQVINNLGQVVYNASVKVSGYNFVYPITLGAKTTQGNYDVKVVKEDGKVSVQKIIVN